MGSSPHYAIQLKTMQPNAYDLKSQNSTVGGRSRNSNMMAGGVTSREWLCPQLTVEWEPDSTMKLSPMKPYQAESDCLWPEFIYEF